jgi:transcriptional regulator with XRE-family HTH domain
VTDIPIGESVRFYRRARKLSQVALATRADVSVDYISAIERGLRTPAVGVLMRLAQSLQVSFPALFGEFSALEPDLVVGASPIQAIETALIGREVSTTATEPDAAALRARVRTAWSTWESSRSRFTEMGQVLPGIIRELNRHDQVFRSPAETASRRETSRTAAELYFLLRSYFRQVGRLDLSLMSADRAVQAAEEASDGVRIAVARWELAHALLASGNFEGSEHVAFTAAEDVRSGDANGDPDLMAMFGALHLVAAVSAARSRRVSTARRLLDEVARPRAEALGERPFWGVWFGLANLGMHAVAVEMEVGRYFEATRLAHQVDVSHLGSIERRSRFFLDLARAYEETGDEARVLRSLLQAEQESPEDLYGKPLARALVRSLVTRSRGASPGVAELAQRMGLG